MMPKDVQASVSRWLISGAAPLDLVSDFALIDYLSAMLYHEFLPAAGYDDFDVRLANWLSHHPSEARQRTMLGLVPYLTFFGTHEFALLRREALDGVIPRFLVDSFAIDLASQLLDAKINAALSATAFVGLTKSGGLREFCKAAHFKQEHYLFADELHASGMTVEQNKFLSSYDAIALVEDFVGTGTQSQPVIDFICTSYKSKKILCLPLICCPDGAALCNLLTLKHTNLTVSPVLSLSPSGFLRPTPTPGEIPIADAVRELINQMPYEVSGYGQLSVAPFGFCDTGALTVLYSNCPDNVLELVHLHNQGFWSALFQRV